MIARTTRSWLLALLPSVLAACAGVPLAADPIATPLAGVTLEVERGGEAGAAQVARALPAALDRVGRWGPLPGPVTVRVHGSGGALAAAAGRPGDTWLRGWARKDSVEIVSPTAWTRAGPSDAAVTILLAHELTHCLLFQRVGTGWSRRDVPSWFEEGMASFTAGEQRARPGTATRSGSPGTGASPAAAYDAADRAFHALVARDGEAAVRAIVDALARGDGFAPAFRAATGIPLAAFEARVGLPPTAAAPPLVTASSTPP